MPVYLNPLPMVMRLRATLRSPQFWDWARSHRVLLHRQTSRSWQARHNCQCMSSTKSISDASKLALDVRPSLFLAWVFTPEIPRTPFELTATRLLFLPPSLLFPLFLAKEERNQKVTREKLPPSLDLRCGGRRQGRQKDDDRSTVVHFLPA